MTDHSEALRLAREILEDHTTAVNSFAGPTLGLIRAGVVAKALIERLEPVEINRKMARMLAVPYENQELKARI